MSFVWSLGFAFWDFRGLRAAALWFKRNWYNQTPLPPWFRTPVVKSRNGGLVEHTVHAGRTVAIGIRGAEFLPALDFGSSLVMPSESLNAMSS